MSKKEWFGTTLAFGWLLIAAVMAGAQTTPPPAPPAAPAFPAAVSQAMDGAALSGVDRADVHLRYVRTLFMPSVPGKIQAVLMFEMNPVELKEELPPPPPATPAAPSKADSSSKTPPPTPPAAPAPVTPPPPATIGIDVFFRLAKADATGAYLPVDEDALIYQEPIEQATGPAIYSVSMTLDPGNYKILMAISDHGFKKIATARADATLPVLQIGSGQLVTTPIIFADSIKQFQTAVETSAHVRKADFAFASLVVKPKLDDLFAPGDSKELFYCVFGEKADTSSQPPKFNLEITYTLMQGKESVIKFAKKTFDAPFINHPMPLTAPDKKLAPGAYTLQVEIEDKLGGSKMKAELPIQIQ